MWQYEKKLQYPVKIKNPNPKYANIIVSQLGGPDGEIGASLRYLTQRIAMPYDKVVGILTDVGTEELAHFFESCVAAESLFRLEEGAAVVPSCIESVDFRTDSKGGESVDQTGVVSGVHIVFVVAQIRIAPE